MNELETTENKGLLWNLLNEGKVFNNIPESRIDLIKIHFENKIKEIKQKSRMGDTLTELNKQIIKDLMKELEAYRNIQKQEGIQRVENVIEEKKTSFEAGLEKHRSDMLNQLNVQAPIEIDFSDKNVDIPNKSYEDIMRERDMDLKMSKNDNKLEIGENIKLNEEELEPVSKIKSVRFEEKEENNFMDGFISKLKTEKASKDELEKKIDEAINNLTEIKEIIKTIHNRS